MDNNNCASCGCNKCTGKYCASKVSIFSQLNEELLREITDNVQTKHYSKGDMLFRSGETADKLYIIKKGKVKVSNYSREGKEQILYLLLEGDFIGELNLLKQSSFEYSAEALEPVSVCIITKQYFEAVTKKNPDITLKILESLHDRVIRLERLIQNLNTKDVEARIAHFLLEYLKDYSKASGNKLLLELPLNKEQIGNYIGVTRETVSRKMAGLQEQGIIEMIGNRGILIKDIDGLKSLV